MQMRLVCGFQNLVKRLTWVEKPVYIHQNGCVGGLVEKLEHSMGFWL